MSYIPLENLLDKADGSVYKLVIMASKRALELSEGAFSLIKDESLDDKPTVRALKEIAAGRIGYEERKK